MGEEVSEIFTLAPITEACHLIIGLLLIFCKLLVTGGQCDHPLSPPDVQCYQILDIVGTLPSPPGQRGHAVVVVQRKSFFV